METLAFDTHAENALQPAPLVYQLQPPRLYAKAARLRACAPSVPR
jgi:hypothetical protein